MSTGEQHPPPEQRRPRSSFYDHYDALPKDTDFRLHPELYRVGRGEQGVLMVEPYKSELVPLWRFATPEIAKKSSAALYRRFLAYLKADDFVGADMARKFIQMGYTRARRYTNYPGGRKYQTDGTAKPRQHDDTKAESARIFFAVWAKVRTNKQYLARKRRHQAAYG